MRVIGGAARGMKLHSPKGTEVRPMLDRVKEALFNILADRFAGASVLDLFAGTGSLGIEALSRGAEHVVFVERDRVCVESIERNLEHTRFQDRADIIRHDALRSLPRIQKLERAFDIVFIDPPYAMTATQAAMQPLERTLKAMDEKDLFAPEAVLMIHHGRRVFVLSPDLPFEIFDERWYGTSGLALLRLAQ
ncbi:MAG: 16S rRNA (guanine(966)-N(2))-methyltransferase RsmD [Planctomycetota bacterium]